MPQIFEAHSLVVALFGLLMASSSFCVQAQVRTETGLPTFPAHRQINSPRAVEDLWGVYLKTGDISLVGRLITAAARPMEGLENASGNEKAMLDFVFTHPPRSNTFLGELQMEMAEQKKAATPVATKSESTNN